MKTTFKHFYWKLYQKIGFIQFFHYLGLLLNWSQLPRSVWSWRASLMRSAATASSTSPSIWLPTPTKSPNPNWTNWKRNWPNPENFLTHIRRIPNAATPTCSTKLLRSWGSSSCLTRRTKAQSVTHWLMSLTLEESGVMTHVNFVELQVEVEGGLLDSRYKAFLWYLIEWMKFWVI